MDWLTFVVEMTKALGFPIAIMFVAFIFRKPLKELIAGRIKSIEAGGVKILFQEAKEKVELLPPSDPAAAQKALPAPTAPDDDLVKHAPLGAIIASYTKLEDALALLAGKAGILIPGTVVNSQHSAAALLNSGVISRQTAEAITAIRQLRNSIVHAPAVQARLGQGDASTFVEMVRSILSNAELDLERYLSTKKTP